jgi:two-component system, OmpR family, sensor histidine kinase KdpD
VHTKRGESRIAETGMLAAGLAAVGLLTMLYSAWLGLTNPTIVALSFLLVVLIAATVSTRWVAVATSLVAFACFNFFFLPPVGTFAVADPQNWVALFTLLAVSVVASHLSSQVRRRAQEAAALVEERKEAEVARRGAELKSVLLASLSHDLKTPLTAVTVAANNLNASWLTDEQRREQAEIVRVELGRLNRLFQDIVDMARIETNAVAAEPEWVEPAEIIEAAARQVEHALDRHRLEIDTSTEKTLVRVDPRLTSAALAHLLENAGQYSPAGSTIAIRVTMALGELQIAVRDRGVGIAQHDLERLFERFYRGVDARQQRFGTGMGLAITRGLLAAEGGRVWAENHPDGGAIFTIAVPADHRTSAALEAEGL